jgi:hypothetical protein
LLLLLLLLLQVTPLSPLVVLVDMVVTDAPIAAYTTRSNTWSPTTRIDPANGGACGGGPGNHL